MKNPVFRGWLANKYYNYGGYLGPVYRTGAVAAMGYGAARQAYNVGSSLYGAARNAYGSYSSSNARPVISGGKSVYRRPMRPKPKPKNKLKKAVRELQHQVRANEGELVYRERQVQRIVTDAVNECELAALSGSSITKLETVIANLRYFNPATPGTYTTVDFTSGTQSKSIRIKMYSKLNIRNNYVVPAKVDIYVCTPKQDTTITTVAAVTAGYVDIGGVDIDSSLMYPSDSPSFTQLWKIVKHTHFTLKPGGERSASFSKPYFDYDPSLVDLHADTYQKHYGSHQYLIRITGVLAHDSVVATEEGFSKAGVDASVVTTYTCRYAAGADIKYIIINDSADTFTNTPNVTQVDTQQETYAV